MLALALLAVVGWRSGASGQEVAPDSVVRELVRLRARVDSLEAVVGELRRAGAEARAARAEEELERLISAAAAAAAGRAETAESTPRFEGRQRALQALNPEISVGGDALSVWQEGSGTEDGILLREVEFAFQATLDPFSRAKVIASHHAHGGHLEPFGAREDAGEEGEGHEHEAGVTVEEAYAQWVNLPGGLALTVGRFRQRLGTYNRWHRHALPWSSMPLPYTVLLGPEGLAQTGLSAYWLAPVEWGAWEIWVEATRSENEVLFGEGTDPSFLAHINGFFELSPSTYIELSASGVTGPYAAEGAEGVEDGRRVVHMEAGLDWRPPGRELYRGLTVRAGLLRTRGPEPGAGGFEVRTATGGFAFAEVRLGRRWLTGLRYDRVQDPADPDRTAWMLVPTLTWWQSEFVRLRAEYDLLDGPAGSRGQFLVQLSYAMGPHKHETY